MKYYLYTIDKIFLGVCSTYKELKELIKQKMGDCIISEMSNVNELIIFKKHEINEIGTVIRTNDQIINLPDNLIPKK